MQGRLQGKRFHARHFLDEVVAHGTEGCNYLLAVDVEMNTVDGYEMSSWARGYGDFAMTPDFSTLRRMPWHPGTALVLADLRLARPRPHAGARVAAADPAAPTRPPRRRRLPRLRRHRTGVRASTANSYEDAYARSYRDLTPANVFNADYSLLQTARIEPLLRRLRNEMYGAGLTPESAKGECNLGQHEIAFRYAEALACCDNHVIYKNGAKEIAAQEGMSITFMAKPNQREGNSCHIHFSLRERRRRPAGGLRRRARAHVAGDGLGDGRPARHDARVHAAVRAEHQLLQAVPGRLVRADRGALGHRQPHLLAAPGRAQRRLAAGGEPGTRRRRQPVPGRRRPGRRCAARHRERAGAGGRVRRQRLRRRVGAARARRRCATRWPCGRAARSPARRSATRSWPTTPTTRGSSWRRSTRRSPTGSCVRGFERL